jgi:flagellar FliJ protein
MFTFKLQAVLDHRQFVEDNLKKQLAEIRNQITTAQKKLESLKGKEMNTTAALKKGQATGLSSDQVVAYHTYLQRLVDRITKQRKRIDEIKEQESEKQGEIREAMKRRQVLEKLKDQGLDRYQKLKLKKEMNFIDEIAINQFVRNTIKKSGEGK